MGKKIIKINAIIIAIIVFAIIGYRKGFLNSFLALFSWLACLVIAIMTAKYVAGWLNSIFNFSGHIAAGLNTPIKNLNPFFENTINNYANKEELIKDCPNECITE